MARGRRLVETELDKIGGAEDDITVSEREALLRTPVRPAFLCVKWS